MTNTTNSLTLVTGATGTTGRRVAHRLAERGLAVRAGSRNGTPPFDWNEPATWPAALDGVTAAYLAYHPDLVAPGAVDTVRRFARAAVEAGARRLVLLSGRGEPAAQEAEKVVLSAGAPDGATVVRSAFFAQNFSEKDFADLVRGGLVALPAGPVTEPFVDAEDIAEVAVAALTGYGHAGRVYEVTGPRLLTFAEATAEIARATGRDIGYQALTTDEFATALATEGVSPELVGALVEVFDTVLDGRSSHLADGVRQALGREPRDFTDYARVTAATGVWASPTAGEPAPATEGRVAR